MMPSTERDRELIADLAAERTGLREAEVVGVRGLAATDEARLLGDITKVFWVTIAPRSRSNEHAPVDAVRLVEVAVSLRGRCMGANKTSISALSSIVYGFRGCGRCDLG